jgi:hypothetical protein
MATHVYCTSTLNLRSSEFRFLKIGGLELFGKARISTCPELTFYIARQWPSCGQERPRPLAGALVDLIIWDQFFSSNTFTLVLSSSYQPPVAKSTIIGQNPPSISSTIQVAPTCFPKT